jgi:hypothetical protein
MTDNNRETNSIEQVVAVLTQSDLLNYVTNAQKSTENGMNGVH